MEDLIMLDECPVCRGAGMIMHEGGWSVQVECTDCSAHTIYMEYNNDQERQKQSVPLHICGTSVRSSPANAVNNRHTPGRQSCSAAREHDKK